MTMAAPTLRERTKTALETFRKFLEGTPFREDFAGELFRLQATADEPCTVAIAGQVKVGKSSFLNALLGADLALTGTTETTATINHFRHGRPPDPAYPVRCVWRDGRATWEPKSFLDGLQGHSSLALQRACDIGRIEFFVEHPLLSQIQIVDTPGTNAAVEEEEHEIRTAEYFAMAAGLRRRHEQETFALSTHADAVVYLTGSVIQKKDVEFLSRFEEHSRASGLEATATHILVVVSRADLNPELTGTPVRREAYLLAESLRLGNQLEVPVQVLAVSSQLRKIAEAHPPGFWADLQSELKEGFADAEVLEDALSGTDRDFCGEWDTSIAPGRRKAIEDSLGDFEWSVRKVVLRELFVSENAAAALENLRAKSGFDEVLSALGRRFFSRGDILRCSTIVSGAHRLLRELKNDALPRREREIRDWSQDEDAFMEYVMEHPRYDGNDDQSVGRRLQTFILNARPQELDTARIRQSLDEIERQFDALAGEIKNDRERCEAEILLEHHPGDFSGGERKELWALFAGGRPAPGTDCARRTAHWRTEAIRAATRERRIVCETAERIYGGYGNEQ